MASHGAKNLMFLSISARDLEEDQAFLKELNAMGSSAQCFPFYVADHDAVKSAIDQAFLPIAGAMQIAIMLCDVVVLDMDLDSWNTAVRPKIE